MRQLIIATVILITLTGASSTLAVRNQAQPVTHCSTAVANSACFGDGLPLEL
jgi:hypothetical protein